MTKSLIRKFSILIGAKCFSSGIIQNYLVFIPPNLGAVIGLINGNLIECQKHIKNVTKSGSNFATTFVENHLLPDVSFNGHYLIEDNISIPKKVIKSNFLLNPQLRNVNPDFSLCNCLFGSVKLTKNADPDEQKYSSYNIQFDSLSEFWFTNARFGKNVIIFGADMSWPVHIGHKGRDILILDKWSTQELDDTTLTAEAIYPINFTKSNKIFLLNLYYEGSNSFLFVKQKILR